MRIQRQRSSVMPSIVSRDRPKATAAKKSKAAGKVKKKKRSTGKMKRNTSR